MFCTNCGCKVVENTKFCYNCGATIIEFSSGMNNTDLQSATQQTNVNSNNEFNRDAINIYLSNVVALEFTIKKLASKFQQLDKNYKNAKSNNYIKRFLLKLDLVGGEKNKENGKYFWLKYDGKEYYIAFHGIENYKKWINTQNTLYPWSTNEKLYWLPIKDNIKFLSNSSNWYDGYAVGKRNRKEQKHAKDEFLKIYPEFVKAAPNEYKRTLKELDIKFKTIKSVVAEYDKACALLKKAYSVNIIPIQFRNLQAEYFIWDFMKTSNESFATALLHCDLDKIKQKLDKIIEQQEQIIINQAIIMAQNKQLLNHNTQVLQKLSEIEQNTERSSQYAQIAANNAEACAWFSLANYIK